MAPLVVGRVHRPRNARGGRKAARPIGAMFIARQVAGAASGVFGETRSVAFLADQALWALGSKVGGGVLLAEVARLARRLAAREPLRLRVARQSRGTAV